jgi:hypothetical protein
MELFPLVICEQWDALYRWNVLQRREVMDKKTKAKIIAVLSEHVDVPKGMEDHICETLYKAYIEVKQEMKND